jgi:hypothetical protein
MVLLLSSLEERGFNSDYSIGSYSSGVIHKIKQSLFLIDYLPKFKRIIKSSAQVADQQDIDNTVR